MMWFMFYFQVSSSQIVVIFHLHVGLMMGLQEVCNRLILNKCTLCHTMKTWKHTLCHFMSCCTRGNPIIYDDKLQSSSAVQWLCVLFLFPLWFISIYGKNIWSMYETWDMYCILKIWHKSKNILLNSLSLLTENV